MRVGWIAMVVAAVAWAGCAGGEPANPNLAAPKLVIAHRADGNATVFLHSAFGERVYDWIHLEIDNATLVNETSTFAVEEIVGPGFYVEASAQFGEALYELRARVDVFRVEERASVALVDADGEWAKEAESFDLPYERLLEPRSNA